MKKLLTRDPFHYLCVLFMCVCVCVRCGTCGVYDEFKWFTTYLTRTCRIVIMMDNFFFFFKYRNHFLEQTYPELVHFIEISSGIRFHIRNLITDEGNKMTLYFYFVSHSFSYHLTPRRLFSWNETVTRNNKSVWEIKSDSLCWMRYDTHNTRRMMKRRLCSC